MTQHGGAECSGVLLGQKEGIARAEDLAAQLLEGFAALQLCTQEPQLEVAERQLCHGGFWKGWLMGVVMDGWRAIPICGKVGAEG